MLVTQINGATPAAALLGGGGAVGTTTQGILPWGWSGTVNSFLTYGSDGLRPLAVSEYNSSLTAAGATENVRTTAAQNLSAPATVNSSAAATSPSSASALAALYLVMAALSPSANAPIMLTAST